MGKMVCEVIPVANFRERIAVTIELLIKGAVVKNMGNYLLVTYG
jgi:hypothetical protein